MYCNCSYPLGNARSLLTDAHTLIGDFWEITETLILTAFVLTRNDVKHFKHFKKILLGKKY